MPDARPARAACRAARCAVPARRAGDRCRTSFLVSCARQRQCKAGIVMEVGIARRMLQRPVGNAALQILEHDCERELQSSPAAAGPRGARRRPLPAGPRDAGRGSWARAAARLQSCRADSHRSGTPPIRSTARNSAPGNCVRLPRGRTLRSRCVATSRPCAPSGAARAAAIDRCRRRPGSRGSADPRSAGRRAQ